MGNQTRQEQIQWMQDTIPRLNQAARAYYSQGQEIMSNLQYDQLYDQLAAMESATGVILAGSPTQRVGYEVVTELPKESHPEKMLSLDKTKSVEALASFVGDQESLLSWKLDGLTVVLTYQQGLLVKAVTRGNGEVGEVITPNARTFVNLPLTIPYKEELILRGEAIIPYSGFAQINETIPETEARYKNPRNLCSGSVRQLDSSITASRRVRFVAFALVQGPGKTRQEQFLFLKEQGFEVVAHEMVLAKQVPEAIHRFAQQIPTQDYPSDGLVVIYNDIAYGKSLGATTKFPRDAMAFKWQDETAETTLLELEWSPSRTGLLNPVAVFAPVELEGTTVTRASVHNVSIVEELALGVGDTISVYKANMIIPQIAENKTQSGTCTPPATCPVCGGKTSLHGEEEGVRTLYCENPGCPAKQIQGFQLFVSRNALNIEGLRSAGIDKLENAGELQTPAEFFRLEAHKDTIIQIEGFGEKSYQKLCQACEQARHTTAPQLLYGLGIPGIGVANARVLAQYGGGDMATIRSLTKEELLSIEGLGEILAQEVLQWFQDPEKAALLDDLLQELDLEAPQEGVPADLEGLTFVVTGSLAHFANRDALKKAIQDRGGKVAGSVSSKTSFLINNDNTSTSSKNKKAQELGIPILTEEDFLQKFGE